MKVSEHRNHVWSYDFIFDRTEDGRQLKFLPVMDEYTRESLALGVERSITGEDVVDVLAYLFEVHGEPAYIRSDNVLTTESRQRVGDEHPIDVQSGGRRFSSSHSASFLSRRLSSTDVEILLSIMNTGSAAAALTVLKTA